MIARPLAARRDPAHETPMPDPTREAAFDLLTAVLDRRRALEDALDALPAIPPRDRAAAHRLAAAVLRRLGTLDAVLEPLLRRQPPDPVRHVLRMGAAGLLLLDTPRHAAVGTAVGSRAGARPGAVRRPGERGAAPGGRSRAGCAGGTGRAAAGHARLALGVLGRDARAIALAHQQEAPLDLTLRPGAEPPPDGVRAADRLGAFPARHARGGGRRICRR